MLRNVPEGRRSQTHISLILRMFLLTAQNFDMSGRIICFVHKSRAQWHLLHVLLSKHSIAKTTGYIEKKMNIRRTLQSLRGEFNMVSFRSYVILPKLSISSQIIRHNKYRFLI